VKVDSNVQSVARTRSLFHFAVSAFLAAGVAPAVPAQTGSCPCDCDTDGVVNVAEIITATNVALGSAPYAACPEADSDNDGMVDVSELIAGINAALDGCLRANTPTPTPTPSSPDNEAPPANAEELLPWLQAGRYAEWPAESAVHPSGGPHFGRVRTYVNTILFESLAAGAPSHPVGAAAVKELYGSAAEVRGWSVSVKLQPDSARGNGWYWYERFRGAVYGDGVGAPGCTGCHGNDFGPFTSKDFILAPFPLQ
jgi:hypothetical protein